jgi:secreted PhoX family phosphatase
MAASPSKHISDLIASRRVLLGGLAGLPLLNLAGCATSAAPPASLPAPAALGFSSVAATNADTITLPPGYRWRTLIAWGDGLFDSVAASFDPDVLTRAEQEQRFGQNNDMLALFAADFAFPPARDAAHMLMCANHEYIEPALMFPGLRSPRDLTAAHVEAMLAATGIAVVALERGGDGWRPVKDSAPGAGRNRRITPFTPVVFSGPAANHRWIAAASAFVNAREPGRPHEPNPTGAVRCGTSANCAGGKTPWGTYLSAEENFNGLFSAADRDAPALVAALNEPAYALDSGNFGTPGGGSRLAPAQFDMSESPYGPALYGWTVEVDPYDPAWAPRKRTALGRRKAECATTALARDGRVVVYSGDDQINEYVYKFVSNARFNAAERLANRDLLDDGQLYVARFDEDGSGRWLPLTLAAANAAARASGYTALFADEGDVLMRAREVARLLGATPMDRPEDVEALLDANWVGLGPVLIVCTNNREQGFAHPGNPRRESANPNRAQANATGHIVRIDEAGADCAATRFTWDIFALAGDPNATALTAPPRDGAPVHVSTDIEGAPTISGERFACPDNICIDSNYNVWIATDGADAVFADCNDSVLVTPAGGDGPRPVKRFLVGPMGAEICGPTMAPDERAFFCAIQHPGEGDVAGVSISDLRWTRGQRPPSNFPDGGDAWPRAAVVVITREDNGTVGS